MNERNSYIALNMMTMVGPVKVRAMVECLGSVTACMKASAEDLQRAKGVGPSLAAAIVEQRERLDPAAEEEKAEKLGIRILTPLDEEYPDALASIHDPPLALYVKGTLEAKDRHAVSMVGSRRSTLYGRGVADQLAYQLAKAGYTVISGLARGIDTAAHQGALKAKGRTLAVLGSAIDELYPPENRELAEAIVKQGCLISEFPLGTKPGKTTFPIRNRIVSGMCMGLVVVEAGYGSGAMITANQALEQGRSVFAVPGRVTDQSSRGCHTLLKQGAGLVEGIDDILEEFELLIPPEPQPDVPAMSTRPEIQLSPVEETIVRALWDGPLTVDALARETELAAAEINAKLLGMEMKRVVRTLPGRRIELVADLKRGA